MKRISVLSLLLVFLLAACQAKPQAELPVSPQQQAAEAGAALQGLLDDQVQKQGILGMAMAVRLADGTVVSRVSGYIDLAKQSPWTIDTVSMLASVTKTYTAVVIMQLVGEGKLALDDTIDRWFPDQPNGDKITVRMLLSHTSGLSEYQTEETQNDPRWSREFPPMDAVAEANRLGPVAEPGGRTAHYTNTNYFVLGLIVEAITGESWEQAVRSRIIEPLDLKRTGFVSEKVVQDEMLVQGYFKTPEGYISNREIPNYPSASTAWANGGVVSSLSDLMTFASALFDGALVSKETLAEMATGYRRRPWWRDGLGPRRRNTRDDSRFLRHGR
jgi:D-alanyl-D-alanine carboxypeptidase